MNYLFYNSLLLVRTNKMTSNIEKEKLFLSFDIESDGPTPMTNNLLSIGIIGITMDEKIIFEYEANIEPLVTHVQDNQCMQTFWLKPWLKNTILNCI